MVKDKFPAWIIGAVTFVAGILLNTFTSGVKVGDQLRVIDGLCTRVEAAETNNRSQDITILNNTGKIIAIEKAIDSLKATAEINRKENREEHLTITEDLRQILKAVK